MPSPPRHLIRQRLKPQALAVRQTLKYPCAAEITLSIDYESRRARSVFASISNNREDNDELVRKSVSSPHSRLHNRATCRRCHPQRWFGWVQALSLSTMSHELSYATRTTSQTSSLCWPNMWLAFRPQMATSAQETAPPQPMSSR